MKITRRAILGTALATPALAQGDWPSRVIRIIVPRAPGGGSDITARLLAPGVSAKLGQTIVVENRPDATAIVGAELVSRSQPDGYTIYVADNSFYFNPSIQPRLPYDTLRDFSCVTMLADAPVVLMTKSDFTAQSLRELIDLAKAEPGKLAFATGGIGASTHFAGVLFALQAGIEIVHVPYRSSGPAMTALLGGEVQMNFGGFASGTQLINAGTIRGLAKTAEGGMDAIPTFAAAGLPGVDVASVWGLHMAAGTPLAIRRRLRDAFAEVMAEPAMARRLVEMGYRTIASTPEEHERQTAEIVNKWIEIGRRIDLNK
ncbi:tripartite tricarboxylate transporter substrate binding protein [Roseococcus sp. SYP-B2431]|uniref:Bug family tripartite tricarboxylate transporter substrate binding protein n=1 Tax=Roseococcus sp. SYP-B2431 TaxID=2496640 RepID=UPI00103B5FE0|nr:tripartite tricarboxylate transporter substrate-binding protein [Roseococcus sp. SYP-B2431]TCH99617.1 tripartite tricarboxylate transporter substrate binding protein [Roseococcus sp. SYP-B2431]